MSRVGFVTPLRGLVVLAVFLPSCRVPLLGRTADTASIRRYQHRLTTSCPGEDRGSGSAEASAHRQAEERKCQVAEAGTQQDLQEVAGRRCALDHHRRRAKAFKQLSNDEERDQFIEAFWQRRDPTPDTDRERIQGRALPPHRVRQRALRRRYSRLEDDRGRMYIMYGPADEIESHPSGGTL